MQWYDAHIHLDQYEPHDLERHIPEWRVHGVSGVLAVATDYRSCWKLLQLKDRFPEFIHIAFGYHPEQPLPTVQERNRLFRLIQNERASLSAIGEVGLPYYRIRELGISTLEPYEHLLRQFAELARDERLPIVLHAVHDKTETAFKILRETGVQYAHFHWLKAPLNIVDQIVDAGYYVSATPEVCYRERDRALVRNVPLTHLLIETDGPWTFVGEFTGQSTTPRMLRRVIEEIAHIKSVPIVDAAAQLFQNFKHIISCATFDV